jgi:hypothetical protein
MVDIFFNVSAILMKMWKLADSFAKSVQFLMLETLMFQPLQNMATILTNYLAQLLH